MSTTPRDRHDPRGTTSPDATGPAPRTQAGETAQAPATAPGRPAAPDPLSDYVAQVRAHLGAAAPALAEDLAELDASLRETADSQGYQTALAAYGPAADYAAALRGSRAADDQADRPGERPPVRRVLGVPTALSPRGLVHRAARSFSPADPLLVPRAYGIGWDVNLGALAVRAGLAHPDDLDDDLDLAPAQMTALSLVPALLALGVAATGTHWAPRGPRQGRAGRAPAGGRGPAVALLPPALAAAALGAVDVLGGASLPQRLGHAVTSVLLTGVGVAGALQRRPGARSARLTQAGVVAAAGALAGGAAVLTLRAAVHRAVHAQRPPAQSTRS
ncbi:DUF5808 domain-containing protein [Actinomyces sp. oral taxon 897]|uniref:DUF5808 domain-containing protein n=1 Tax=Actinomyces sp. oral taxon 897 TaxID=2081702 RepID=UPI000D03647B|nr:DUF5808 domain-containing protein [Actinomyces sp. oral taxon 897]AVM60803.1 hypothetical protein C3V41_00460 [Actinomyces sp. oral taxon 897]